MLCRTSRMPLTTRTETRRSVRSQISRSMASTQKEDALQDEQDASYDEDGDAEERAEPDFTFDGFNSKGGCSAGRAGCLLRRGRRRGGACGARFHVRWLQLKRRMLCRTSRMPLTTRTETRRSVRSQISRSMASTQKEDALQDEQDASHDEDGDAEERAEPDF